METNKPVLLTTEERWRGYLQVQEAIDGLYVVVWDRWHPLNPTTQGQAPKDVYDALEDLRPLVLEIQGLWERLGVSLGQEGGR